MATERQRQIVLGVVVVVLAFVLYRAATSSGFLSSTTESSAGTQGTPGAPGVTSGGSIPSSNGRARTARSGRGGEPPATAPDVHLRALDDERPKPVSGDRN